MTHSDSKTILNRIFSHDLFKTVDTDSLVRQFDITDDLIDAHQTPEAGTAPKVQTDKKISSIPPEGIVINEPGSFQITEDIEWAPTTPCSAITIETNDVVLDFKSFTIAATSISPDTDIQFNGVRVKNAQNVVLQNGSITGATYYGIMATGAPDIAILNMTISDMNYKNTAKRNLTVCGIFVESSNNFTLEGCTVKNLEVTAPSCAGLQIIKSIKGTVTDCTMQNFLNHDGGVQGFSYLLCEEITTESCSAKTFQSHYMGQTKTTGHTVIGYVPIFCYSLTFNSCSSTDMKGSCDDCHGMSVFIDMNVSVTEFSATNVTDGLAPVNTGAKATGLEVYGVGVSLSDCYVENIKAIRPQDLQSAGYSVWGAEITLTNCTATDIQVVNEKKKPDTTYGYGVGFGWAPDPRPEFKSVGATDTQYNRCTSENCQVGFDTWSHIDSKWADITTDNCAIPLLVQPKGATRTFSMDNCSESPSGMPECITVKNMANDNTYPEMESKS